MSTHQSAAQDDCGGNSRTCSLHTLSQKSDAAGPLLPPGDTKTRPSHFISKVKRRTSEFYESHSAGVITLMQYLSSRSAVAVKKPVPGEQHRSLTNNSCSRNILSVRVLTNIAVGDICQNKPFLDFSTPKWLGLNSHKVIRIFGSQVSVPASSLHTLNIF